MARANLLGRDVGRPDLRVDRQLAEAPSDELCVLRPEVENDDGLMAHRTDRHSVDRWKRLGRYYSGVAVRRTTICCSAIALVVACCVDVVAQTAAPASRPVKQTRSADDKSPLQLFPVAALWTLSLNNALTAAPAFDETRVFFPLEGDQLAAYDLAGRRLLWIAPVRTTVEPAVGEGLGFVVEPEFLVALRVEDGVVAWKVPVEETLAVPPVLAGGGLGTATTTRA